jgi:hypothetical protein
MEFGRRKAEAMLILFRVRQHNEKPAKVLPALLAFGRAQLIWKLNQL